jgi:hypothetical protein
MNRTDTFGAALPRRDFRRVQIRKFLIIAAGLLGVLAATGSAPASSLHTFKAICTARDGYFGIVDQQAVCQLPSGRILTMSESDGSYDFDRPPAPSLSLYFGSHHHHCKPLKEQMLLSGSGDCSDRMPIKSKPIEMGKPALEGLYHK